MIGTMFHKVREATINGVAFVLIRAAGVVYFGAMTVLAIWSIVHSLVLPSPAYA